MADDMMYLPVLDRLVYYTNVGYSLDFNDCNKCFIEVKINNDIYKLQCTTIKNAVANVIYTLLLHIDEISIDEKFKNFDSHLKFLHNIFKKYLICSH